MKVFGTAGASNYDIVIEQAMGLEHLTDDELTVYDSFNCLGTFGSAGTFGTGTGCLGTAGTAGTFGCGAVEIQ